MLTCPTVTSEVGNLSHGDVGFQCGRVQMFLHDSNANVVSTPSWILLDLFAQSLPAGTVESIAQQKALGKGISLLAKFKTKPPKAKDCMQCELFPWCHNCPAPDVRKRDHGC